MKCHIRNTLDHFTSFPLSGVVSPRPRPVVLATGSWATPRGSTWPLQGGGQSGSSAQAVNSCRAWLQLQVTFKSPEAALRLSLLLWKLGRRWYIHSHGAGTEGASGGSEAEEDGYSQRTVPSKRTRARQGAGICPRDAQGRACSFTGIYWEKKILNQRAYRFLIPHGRSWEIATPT